MGGGGAHPQQIRGDGPLGLDGQDEMMMGEGTMGSSLSLQSPSMAPPQVGQPGDGGESDQKKDDNESKDTFNSVHLRLYPL